ncbi:MAG: glycosyl hydrolase family 18 protein, partial [bacterium]
MDSATIHAAIVSWVNHIVAYNYDGAEIDWETRTDAARFDQLCRMFRAEYARRGFSTPKLLMAAIGRTYLNGNSPIFNASTINTYLDYAMSMNYDANQLGSCTSGFHNPLFEPKPNWPTMENGFHGDIATCIQGFLDGGVNPAKFVIGLSLYPRIWYRNHIFRPAMRTIAGFGWGCVGEPNICEPAQPEIGEPSCNEGIAYWIDTAYPMILAGATENYDTLAAMAWLGDSTAHHNTGLYLNYNNRAAFAQKMGYINSLSPSIAGVMLFANEHGAAHQGQPIMWNGVLSQNPLMDEFRAALSPSAPTITTQPSNTSAYVGATAIFTVVASGTPTAYQWQENNVNIAGATSSLYTTGVLTPGKNGHTFRCLVSNFVGTATSNEATLTVTNSAPSITSQPVNRTVASGQTASFSLTAVGSLPLNYQWQVGGVNISGATNSAYTTSATTFSDNGKVFRCVITNALGSVSSNNAILTISTPSTANPTSDDFSNTARFTTLWKKSHPQLTSLIGGGTSDALLRLNLDATPHEMGGNDYSAVRVLQDITDGNFEVVAKFQTLPSATYQWEGILVKEHASSFLRFDIIKDNGGLKFYAGKASATNEQKILTAVNIPGLSVWVKVKREADVWTASYSTDGSIFIQTGQFVQAMAVDSIGVYAGNQTGGSGVPAFDCKVDYFFNVNSPINPEDPVS